MGHISKTDRISLPSGCLFILRYKISPKLSTLLHTNVLKSNINMTLSIPDSILDIIYYTWSQGSIQDGLWRPLRNTTLNLEDIESCIVPLFYCSILLREIDFRGCLTIIKYHSQVPEITLKP